MPYITKGERLDYSPKDIPADNPGQLNYQITELINLYLYNIKDVQGQWRYQHLNDVLGALEGAKLEFYRRVAVPYEEIKMLENGDVYL